MWCKNYLGRSLFVINKIYCAKVINKDVHINEGPFVNNLISWFRLCLVAVLLVPFLLAQSYLPPIPAKLWETWSEAFYPALNPNAPLPAEDSAIAIIEIGPEDERLFGWPIDREKYVNLLSVLKDKGDPWILSYLRFAMAGQTVTELQQNQKLAEAIADYGKYIGSGLTLLSPGKEELTFEQEEGLLPKALMTSKPINPEEIPGFSLALDEHESFMQGQKAFGMGMRFGTQSKVYCAPLFFRDLDPKVTEILPTSILWAAAYHMQADIKAPQGARTFGAGSNALVQVGSSHCLSHPSWATRPYFAKRGIAIIPFHKALSGAVDFKGKLVVLASARMRNFQGPGADVAIPGSGIVPEHLLSARFLDDLITGQYKTREPLLSSPWFQHVPLLVFAILLVVSWFFGIKWLLGLIILGLVATVAMSAYYSSALNIYLIPLPLFGQLFLTGVGVTCVWIYLAYYGIRRVGQFRERLRQQLVPLQDYDAFATGVESYLASQIRLSDFLMKSPYGELYAAAASPETVAAYLAKNQATKVAGTTTKPEAAQNLRRRQGWSVSGRVELAFLSMAVVHDETYLGECHLRVIYQSWEKGMMLEMLRVLSSELTEQWNRVHRLIEGKISDYELLINSTRTKILEQFLAESLIKKFSDGRTMEENLREVLVPKEAQAAILQADIRGFSSLFANQDSASIVQLLSSYYSRTVDYAQRVANVKLIGDCIFLFIEEDPKDIKSAADYALQLAGILIAETEAENEIQKREHGRDPVVFGIAIHFGNVIMGNLSSSSCIDYTVIGPDVNRTARMEEITKKPSIRDKVGANGVLLSVETEQALRFYRGRVAIHQLNLAEQNVEIRSFETIQQVCFVKAAEAAQLAAEELILDQAS